jgi:hypothetical protein
MNVLEQEAASNTNVANLKMEAMLLENLKQQQKFWKPHQRSSIIWAFLKMNNNKLVCLEYSQVMHCIVCHNWLQDFSLTHKMCKGLIVYHKANGISTMKKHVEQKYVNLL